MRLFYDYWKSRQAGELILDQSYILPYFSQDDATFSEDPEDLVHQYGDMVSALLYSTIFFPEFIEVEGSVILKGNVHGAENQFRSRKIETKMSLAEFEAAFNSIEVAYLFSNRRISTTNSAYSDATEQKLAKIIADS
jgi:hypothetical protein